MRAGLQPTQLNQPDSVLAYVALGANLGDTVSALRQAVVALNSLPLTQVRHCSSLYQTAPQGTDCGKADEWIAAPGDDYLNAVVELQTSLSAPALLDGLQQIEQVAGRVRPYRNAPRTLDLDLLLYGSARIESTRLTLPHPRMAQRAFVLMPLAEIAPDLVSAEQLQAVQRQPIRRLGPLNA
jgi:2-amino-4-hydroxy-6-hydroxymethyldihydropteridine diphosphokinase